MVSSLTSATRTNGWRASILRWKMLVSRASSRTVTPAVAANASATSSHVRPLGVSRVAVIASSAARTVAGAGVAVQAVELPVPWIRAGGDVVHQRVVAAHAVHPHQLAVVRRDLDRLLPVLERERRGMPEPVL